MNVSTTRTIRFVTPGEPGPQGEPGVSWSLIPSLKFVDCDADGVPRSGQKIGASAVRTQGAESVALTPGQLQTLGYALKLVQIVDGEERLTSYMVAGTQFAVSESASAVGIRLQTSAGVAVTEVWVQFRVLLAEVNERLSGLQLALERQQSLLADQSALIKEQSVIVKSAADKVNATILPFDGFRFVPPEAVRQLGQTGSSIRVVFNNASGAVGFLGEVVNSSGTSYGCILPELDNGHHITEYGEAQWSGEDLADRKIVVYKPDRNVLYRYVNEDGEEEYYKFVTDSQTGAGAMVKQDI